MEVKEERIRRITSIYYSNPKVQEAILKFASGREVVPRYFEQFGKRPDTLQYPSDIRGLVKNGATSFHASEEIWEDPLKISSDMIPSELNEIRKDWNLVMDIDSEYLDLSKVLALLVCSALEKHGVKNYGIKYSGSRGFHIIVSGKAFPDELYGRKKNEAFPEWPRAICEYLMNYVKRDYNKKAVELMNVGILKKRKGLKEEDILESSCPRCGRSAKKGKLIIFGCDECGFEIQRKDMKLTKRRLICPQNDCPGILEVKDEKDYFQCGFCENVSSIDKRETSGKYKAIFSKEAKKREEFNKEVSGEKFGASDLVLVAPRHLLRVPYSLHERTALASVVIDKNEIEKFDPIRDANPLKVKIKDFLPENEIEEGRRLLISSLDWKKKMMGEEEKIGRKKYGDYEDVDLSEISEESFPKPINKLLKGLKEGRKRGLFVLLTFYRSLGFSAEYINSKVREWNKKNEVPLKEGYIKSQIDWHLKQKRKILPPNYSNNSFYRDIGILDEVPKVKNPLVEVKRNHLKSSRRGREKL